MSLKYAWGEGIWKKRRGKKGQTIYFEVNILFVGNFFNEK